MLVMKVPMLDLTFCHATECVSDGEKNHELAPSTPNERKIVTIQQIDMR